MTTLPGDDRDPLEVLAQRYLERRRAGEDVDLPAFAAEHPEHRAAILELFPTLLRIEEHTPPEPATPADRLGRWTIQRELGRGGMGVVYLARDGRTGERAALKVLSSPSATGLARFRREAEAVRRVEHPGICRVLDVGEDDGRAWIALEHVEGETVAAALRRVRRGIDEGGDAPGGTPTAPERWLEVGEQAARALHAAHEVGLVHRDVKPSNLMLRPDGSVVVLDFGLAAGAAGPEATRITNTGVPIGTPAYMSPEQVRAGGDGVDRRTDVYSLGATLYECLTLEPPFAGPTVAALFAQILTQEAAPVRRRVPALSRDLELVLATALEKDPRRRYATALALAEDLARVRRGEALHARPVSAFVRLSRWAVRNPRLAATVGAVAMALVVGLGVALVLLARVADERDRADVSARRARARGLASASAAALGSDAMLGLLLAREAVDAERTPETVSQLHAAVHGSLERARLPGHGGPVESLAWDAEERLLATGCRDGRARVFAFDGALLCTVKAGATEGDPGVRVALSPDGSRFATLSGDGRVRVWSAGGVELALPSGVDGPASQALYLADGVLVVVGAQGRIALVEEDGRLRAAWALPVAPTAAAPVAQAVPSLAGPARLHVLTREGRALTYDAEGVELHRHDAAWGDERAVLIGGGRVVHSVRAEAGEPAPGSPHRAADGALRVTGPDGSDRGRLALKLTPETLLTGSASWWCVWDPQAGAYLVEDAGGAPVVRAPDLQRSERPAVLEASADGARLLTVRAAGLGTYSSTDPVRLWSARAVPLAPLTTGGDLVVAAAFSPRGRFVALGFHTGDAVTVHATVPQELVTGAPHWRLAKEFRHKPLLSRDGRSCVVLADAEHLDVLRDDGTRRARIALDAVGGPPLRYADVLRPRDLLLVTGRTGACACFTLDGERLWTLAASAGAEKAWWTSAEGHLAVLARGEVRFFRPDRTLAVTAPGRGLGPDPSRGVLGTQAVVDPEGALELRGPEGDVLRRLPVPNATWYHAAPSGLAVVIDAGLEGGSGRGLGTCVVVDSAGKQLWEAPVRGAGIRCAFVSPGGDRVLVPGSRGASLRDLAGAEIAALHVPGGLTDAAFDPQGNVVVAGVDGTVRVWDRDGRDRFTLPSQGGGAFVGFSAEGRRVGVNTPTLARLYTTDVDELVLLARQRSTRALTPAERTRFADLLATGR